jgi:hypothetical protein
MGTLSLHGQRPSVILPGFGSERLGASQLPACSLFAQEMLVGFGQVCDGMLAVSKSSLRPPRRNETAPRLNAFEMGSSWPGGNTGFAETRADARNSVTSYNEDFALSVNRTE